MAVTIAQQYFLDPIGGQVFADPVMNVCGHSYNKTVLYQWKDLTKKNECPLCRTGLQTLIVNRLLQQAAKLVLDPPYREYTQVDQVTNDEHREIIEGAIAHITKRREQDQCAAIPSKLDPYFGSGAFGSLTKLCTGVTDDCISLFR